MPLIKKKSKKVEETINKHISMKEIVKGLLLDIGDISVVNREVLIVNDLYEFVRLGNRQYSSYIPNLVLGMVSGKYTYTVYVVKSNFKVEA